MSSTCFTCSCEISEADLEKCLFVSPIYGQHFTKKTICQEKLAIPKETILTFCIKCSINYLFHKTHLYKCNDCGCFSFNNGDKCHDCEDKTEKQQPKKNNFQHKDRSCCMCSHMENSDLMKDSDEMCNMMDNDGFYMNGSWYEYIQKNRHLKTFVNSFTERLYEVTEEISLANFSDTIEQDKMFVCKKCFVNLEQENKLVRLDGYNCDMCNKQFYRGDTKFYAEYKNVCCANSSCVGITFSSGSKFYNFYNYRTKTAKWISRIMPTEFKSREFVCDDCCETLMNDNIIEKFPVIKFDDE